MTSIIAILIWEVMLLIVASNFYRAMNEKSDNNLLGIIVMTIVFVGLAILPFTGALVHDGSYPSDV